MLSHNGERSFNLPGALYVGGVQSLEGIVFMTNRRQFLTGSATFAAATAISGVSAAIAGGSGRTGAFSGRSNHVTTGRAEVLEDEVVLMSDFSLDGAPDPRVGLGKDGQYDASTDMGKLANLTGKQSYKVPAGIDTSDYNEVYIWCRKFSVPLGVARLN